MMAHFRSMDLDTWTESIALNDQILDDLDSLSRKITNFRKTRLKN